MEDEEGFDQFIEGYEPLFELGFFEDESPAVRVVSEGSLCPAGVAALCVAMFETVMRTVSEHEQIIFEEKFRKSFEILMEERFNYDVVTKYPDDEQD